MTNYYGKIETRALEQIHYIQCKVITQREKNGSNDGIVIDTLNKAPMKIAKEIFEKITNDPHELNDSLVNLKGSWIYVKMLWLMPLEKLKQEEIKSQRELKLRRELKRQRLDQSNLDQLIVKTKTGV